MRADERDIKQYFRRKVGISEVRDVILLRDKRTGRHKGCAYVEVGRLEDIDRALAATGKTPDFQRFPILVKRAEAEKNALALGGGAVALGSLSFIPPTSIAASALVNHSGQPVQLTAEGMRVESQKVYVGSIDPCITQMQLHALFSQFGTLEKVLLQSDATTGMSRGFAFLTYLDPKDANLAIQTMSGQILAGRPL
jgi:RNA recognition motif-containing protein